MCIILSSSEIKDRNPRVYILNLTFRVAMCNIRTLRVIVTIKHGRIKRSRSTASTGVSCLSILTHVTACNRMILYIDKIEHKLRVNSCFFLIFFFREYYRVFKFQLKSAQNRKKNI